MLEIRNITKIYHSKSGNSVKALDNVSLTFSDTGMVFVLGKSGSGKSTLLNVIGGLDGCDNGEFIIKGKSSKSFAGSDFDAYRNTFIGFIFQEYNVLDDFTVGANIGLALELQGKKATNEKINDILAQVDMLDYAKRKPNELSGGQKQRVAIARALVKDPEIIMADEPTGALDSNTGKQIFDTLKALSRTKLVIVVSHDRDFAERYADRIIEMKDGRIESDVTKHEVEAAVMSDGILKMSDNLLRIEKGYQLTERDVELINQYLRDQNAEILVSGDKRINDSVRSVAGISQNNSSSIFNDTDAEKDIKTKEYKANETKFIRSSLPFKNALKMGSSSLGHKKFRLVMTIILSLIAFALFGFADTLGGYDKITAATDSIVDANIQNATFSLSLKHTWGNGEYTSSYYNGAAMNDEDIALLSQKTGLEFIPVFNGSATPNSGNISVTEFMIDTDNISHDSVYTGSLYGLTSVDAQKLSQLGFSITGRMPEKAGEIAISELMYRQFNDAGFKNSKYNENIKPGQLNINTSEDSNSIIGKHITLNVQNQEYSFVITAVIDTGFDYVRYEDYIPDKNDSQMPSSNQSEIMDMVMRNELINTLRYGFHCLGYITEADLDPMIERLQKTNGMSYIGTSMYWNAYLEMLTENGESMHVMSFNNVAQSHEMKALGKINWIDGVERTTLGTNEMVVSSYLVNYIVESRKNISEKTISILRETYGEYWNDEYRRYDLSGLVRELAVDKYISENFETYKDKLQSLYKQGDAYIPDASDEELRTLWRNNGIEWASDTQTNKGVYSAAYKDLLQKLVGKSYDGYPEEFYEIVIQNCFSGMVEDLYFSNNYNAKYFAIYEYSFKEMANGFDYNSQEFFREVMEPRLGSDASKHWENYSDAEKRNMAAVAYADYIFNFINNDENAFGGKKNNDFTSEAQNIYQLVTGEETGNIFDTLTLAISTSDMGNEIKKTYPEFKIVGIFDDPNGEFISIVASDTLYGIHEEYINNDENFAYKETVVPHDPGAYAFLIAQMPKDKQAIRELVELNYDETQDIKFNLENQVIYTLYSFNDFIEMGAKIFVYVGIGFAVFAALMLMNFISVSISYKRREIGILRAVGARSSDVFKIFFSEASIIALINYVLSVSATVTIVMIFNNYVRKMGINITLLSFGIRQIALMLLISIFVAGAASFLPVWNIARRKPVDAIKNK